MRVKAPAKVNLTLDVLGRRLDGYHNISSVMQTIGWRETLDVNLSDCPGVVELTIEDHTRSGALFPVPTGENNLVTRAAVALLTAVGESSRHGAKIHLRKNIPTQAGLGGGSSDAAATLMALNSLLGEPLTREQIVPIAAHLGADVPFFLWGGTCLVEGIGERVTQLSDSPLFEEVFVIKPDVGVSTPAAYKAIDDMRGTIEKLSPRQPSWDSKTLYNDFEDAVYAMHPELRELRNRILEAGCSQAILSGSGSAVFGTVANDIDEREAMKIFVRLANSKPKLGAFCYCSKRAEAKTEAWRRERLENGG